MQPESVNQPGTPNVSRLPVQDFLQLANWEGAPVAPPQPPTSITPLFELAVSSAATTTMAVATALSAAEIAAEVAAMTEPQLGTSAGTAASWQCLTVEQFFARQNWQGLAQPAVPVATVATVAAVMSETPVWQPTLTATVKDFFQNLPWTAEPTIGAMPKTEAVAAPAEPEMTLSDLSDLF
jgi:hypothetical protein